MFGVDFVNRPNGRCTRARNVSGTNQRLQEGHVKIVDSTDKSTSTHT